MMVAGRKREYLIRVPTRPPAGVGKKWPLLVYLHGGGGKAQIDPKEGKSPWIVIAPDAVDRAWNVAGIPHRSTKPRDRSIDDVTFIKALIDLAVEREDADPRRVAVGGISRGGMMAFQALSALNDRIGSGAIAIASLPALLREGYKLPRPTHILIMNGTADPLVRYEGGFGSFLEIKRPELEKYDMLPTEEVARDLAVRQGLDPEPKVTRLPDKKDDGCSAEKHEWRGTASQGSVTLIKVIGGGHTIPGLPQALPESIVGKTCQDFNGFELIGDFLDSAPPRAAAEGNP
jgi:polyhydroxybutyrate depolymerase